MPTLTHYERGDWNATCDICGFGFKFSELIKCWDGSYRDAQCAEPRNPQDFVRAVKDDPSIPVARPRTVPFALNIYEVMQNNINTYYSTPTSAANSITGDCDFVTLVSMADWQQNVAVNIINKAVSGQISYVFELSGGFLIVQLSADGTTRTTWTSTAQISAAANSQLYLKASYVQATGTVSFFTSTDGATWTALGTPVVHGSITIFVSTTPLKIGFCTSVAVPVGKIFTAQIYNGIGGTLVSSFVAADYPLPGILPMTKFTSLLTGEVYTPIGAAFITGAG